MTTMKTRTSYYYSYYINDFFHLFYSLFFRFFFWISFFLATRFLFPSPSFQKKQRQERSCRHDRLFFFIFLSFTRNIDAIRSLVRQRKSKAIILNTARESRFSQFLTSFSLSLSLSLCVCAFIICARNRHSDCAFKTTYSLAEFVCLLLVHQEKSNPKKNPK